MLRVKKNIVQPRAVVWALILISIVGAIKLNAQAVSQISGTVTDPSGSVVPGVQVTATQTETGTKRTTATDSSGAFVLTNLPVGPYQLDATKSGFRSYVQTGVVLQVSSSPVIPITLAVGQVSEKIEVEANAGLVEVRAMGVGNVIENQRILDLPLNGRQPTDLIALSGAAVPRGGSGPFSVNTGITISVAGGLSYGVAYSLDGASFSNVYDATGFPLPFPDALQEFKVETSALSAQAGTHSGASVSGVTKSGTNAFHGDLFEFIRNGDFNARNFFAASIDSLKRNQFGGTVGGPIRKDKLFFFGGYQGTTIRSDPSQTTEFVPTAQMLAGNFSTYASAQCQGTAINLPAPFVNNHLAQNFFSPAALKITSHLPTSGDPCGKVLTGIPVHENDHQIVAKVDYQLSPSQTMFARYIGTFQRAPIPFTIPGASVLATTAPGTHDLAQTVAIGHTWLISATTVNSLRLGMNREAADHPAPSFFGPTDVGIPGYALDTHFLPFSVTGGFTIGGGLAAPITLNETALFLNEDINLVRGSHQIAFGLDATQALVVGTAHVIANGTYNSSSLADFLIGQLTPYVQSSANNLVEYKRFFGLYAQDTWKATRRLTLNYGLRWEPSFPNQVKDNKVYTFSLAAFQQHTISKVYPDAPAGFSYPGDPGFNGQAASNPTWSNFAPRIGFAWDPRGDGKTSIRGGAGLSYDFANMQQNHWLPLAAPFGSLTVNLGPTFQGPNLDHLWANAPFNGVNPFPYNFNPGSGLPHVFGPGSQFTPVPQDFKNAQVQQWNLALQRQFTTAWFVSASYVGSHVIHAFNMIELNPFVITKNSSGVNVNAGRLLGNQDPYFANIVGPLTSQDSSATQYYNGLLLNTTYRKRNANVNVNYTWSHCVGDDTFGDAVPGPATNDSNTYLGGNRRFDRGNCLTDRRHVFNVSAVAQSPRFNDRTVRMLASNWTLSGIYQVRNGDNLTVSDGVNQELSGVATANQRPNLVLANPYCTDALRASSGPCQDPLQLLNPAAFKLQTLGTIGNLGNLSIHGPRFWVFDMSLSRSFQIREGQRLEVRAEAFNLLNKMRPNDGYSQYSGPGVSAAYYTLTSATFGKIISSFDPRIMQFALKYTF